MRNRCPSYVPQPRPDIVALDTYEVCGALLPTGRALERMDGPENGEAGHCKEVWPVAKVQNATGRQPRSQQDERLERVRRRCRSARAEKSENQRASRTTGPLPPVPCWRKE
jgi:hypothetical protein